MKIVNRKKFVKSLIIMFGLLAIAIIGIQKTYCKEKIVYKEDYIVEGDTLWSIAQNEINTNEYYKNKDIRDVMYEIKTINHIGNEKLEIGKKIIIPQT